MNETKQCAIKVISAIQQKSFSHNLNDLLNTFMLNDQKSRIEGIRRLKSERKLSPSKITQFCFSKSPYFCLYLADLMISILLQIKMHGIKLVDNYELMEEKGQMFDGIQIIPARHKVQNKLYSLKKLKLNDENKDKHMALVNQITILKELQDQRVIICHKMLKTTSNIYVSYDYISPNHLQSFIQQHRNTLRYAQKRKIAQKITQFFRYLKANQLVNLNIKPINIEILSLNRKQQKELRFNSFQYSLFINKPVPEFISKSIPQSEFVAPEGYRRQAKIGHHSSIFTLGKLFEFIGLNCNSQGNINQNLAQFIKLIQKMTNINEILRPNLQQVISILKKLNQSDNQKSYLSIPSKEKGISSSRSNQSFNLQITAKVSLPFSRSKSLKSDRTYFDDESNKINVNEYSLAIIKRRNLSIFLLKCCSITMKIDLVECNMAVQMGFILLKKSVAIMSQLYSLMCNGKHSEINIPEKQMTIFYKSPDFFRLQSIICKDLNYSKKYLTQMIEVIGQSYTDLFQKSIFMKETKSQEINNEDFKVKILEFLKKCIESRRIHKVSKDILKYMLIMSYISDFLSFEQMFKQLINQQIIELQKQTLFAKISEMDQQTLVNKLLQFLQKVRI